MPGGPEERRLDSPRAILERRGLRPKHSWGQNFLSDDDVLGAIVAAAGLGPGDVAVELGPGLGHLTRALLGTGARVVAVERDRDMVEALGELATSAGEGLTVVAGNAADVRFAALAGTSPVTVVGNLPYHLTSPILFEVLDQQADVRRAVFTVQKEVADRVAAPAGTRASGVLTVLLGLRFDAELVREVPRRLFHPPPNVDSAVLRLERRPTPRAEVDERRFRRVVKAAFGHRRKTLLNALRADPELGESETVRAALEAAGIDATRRAETLLVEDFARLTRALSAAAPP